MAFTAVVVNRVSEGGRLKRVFQVSSGVWCGCLMGLAVMSRRENESRWYALHPARRYHLERFNPGFWQLGLKPTNMSRHLPQIFEWLLRSHGHQRFELFQRLKTLGQSLTLAPIHFFLDHMEHGNDISKTTEKNQSGRVVASIPTFEHQHFQM